MPIRKRGVNLSRGFYFKRKKIVLESASSKAVFFGILLLFSVVIVLAGLEVKEISDRNIVFSPEKELIFKETKLDVIAENVETNYNDNGEGSELILSSVPSTVRKFEKIATGYVHTCALSGEDAFCWGENDVGQIGDGTISAYKSYPSFVNLTALNGDKFVFLDAGGAHTCGITSNNHTFCWGYDLHGQLGDGGSNLDKAVPTLINESVLGSDLLFSISLSAGSLHTCGLSQSGRIYCWGDDNFGQLGNDEFFEGKTSPVPVIFPEGVDSFISVAIGRFHTCAVANNHKTFCWGRDNNGQLGDNLEFSYKALPVEINSSSMQENEWIASLYSGDYHTCGITNFNRAFCWGDDNFGQLANIGSSDDYNDQPVPTLVNNTLFNNKNLISLSLGSEHSCGFDDEGIVYCWGRGSNGQLGNGNIVSRSLPVLVNITPLDGDIFAIGSLDLGLAHTCGITSNNHTFCWGLDQWGQLGDSIELNSKKIPSLVGGPLPPIILTSKCPQAFEREDYICPIDVIDPNGDSYSIELNETTTCSWARADETINLVTGSPSISDINPSCEIRVIVKDSSDLESTKNFSTGVFPLNSSIPFTSFHTGAEHSCATTGNNVYCWGKGEFGELGNGSSGWGIYSNRPTIVNVSLVEAPTIKKVGVGKYHSCLLTIDGKAYCFGAGYALGDGDINIVRSIPYPVNMTNVDGGSFLDIFVGGQSTCAISVSGKTYCWGEGSYGQLGNGFYNQNIPHPVNTTPLGGDTFVTLDLSNYNSCGITNNNRTFCWGRNQYGMLGNGINIDRIEYPTLVNTTPLGNDVFTTISVGSITTCGLTKESKVFCWGGTVPADGSGILSNPSPFLINTDFIDGVFTQISSSDSGENGGYNLCGVTNLKEVYCWGMNHLYQSGNCNLPYVEIPTKVNTSFRDERFSNVFEGDRHACGLTESGRIYCWGHDEFGKLGNGPVDFGLKPLLVCSPTMAFMPFSQISCGNSILEEGEQCDDGNTINWDGCSSTCGIETHYKVFVTSSTYNGKIVYGNYFGINAADMICNAKARDAGYAYSKKWKAWLSSSAQSASQRIYHSPKAYRTKDMSIIANNWNDLVDGSLDNPINLDERGNLINSGIAWSGSLENGESSSYNCKNWTSNMINDFGNSGYINNSIGWSSRGGDKCNSFNRIYCFEQPSCGNGFVDQSNEQCDDGNLDNGDGCGTDCRLGSGGGKGTPKDITPPRDSLTA